MAFSKRYTYEGLLLTMINVFFFKTNGDLLPEFKWLIKGKGRLHTRDAICLSSLTYLEGHDKEFFSSVFSFFVPKTPIPGSKIMKLFDP